MYSATGRPVYALANSISNLQAYIKSTSSALVCPMANRLAHMKM